MKDPDRPRIPLRALWRIPAVIALVACAIISRMALGATGPVALPGGGAAALRELAAAMVVAGGAGADPHADTRLPAHHGFAFDSRLLLDIAEAIYVLPPVGVANASDDKGDVMTAVASLVHAAVPPHCTHAAPAKI